MAEPETPTQALATHLLGRDVRGWIVEQRELGHTWRHISTALKLATDGKVNVSHESLRTWIGVAA